MLSGVFGSFVCRCPRNCYETTNPLVSIKKKKREKRKKKGKSNEKKVMLSCLVYKFKFVCVFHCVIKDRVKSFATTYIFLFLPLHLAPLQPVSFFDSKAC
ncbi:hypothetical protein Hdeb2414_s0004g00140041 [Helianthus debilis subsp. tardiflorus]